MVKSRATLQLVVLMACCCVGIKRRPTPFAFLMKPRLFITPGPKEIHPLRRFLLVNIYLYTERRRVARTQNFIYKRKREGAFSGCGLQVSPAASSLFYALLTEPDSTLSPSLSGRSRNVKMNV